MQIIKKLSNLPLKVNEKYLLENITYLNEKKGIYPQVTFTIKNTKYQINSQKIFKDNRKDFEGKGVELWFLSWKDYRGEKRVKFSLDYEDIPDEPTDIMTVFYLIDVDGSLFIKWHKKVTKKTINEYKDRIKNNDNMTLIDSVNIPVFIKPNYILNAMFKYMKDSTYGDYLIRDTQNHTTWKFICEVVLNEDSYTKKNKTKL